jgi:hypothetical protein
MLVYRIAPLALLAVLIALPGCGPGRSPAVPGAEDCSRAAEAGLENTWRCPRAELLAGPDALAVPAAAWFFERFGWHEESEGMLATLQSRIFAGR